MALVLDDGNTQFTLPDWLVLAGRPFAMRYDSENRAFQHGGIPTGDKKMAVREIYLMTADDSVSELYPTKELAEAALRELIAKLMRPNQKLIVDNEYYINIETVEEFDHAYVQGWERMLSTFNISLLATDPFLYALTETEIKHTTAAASENISITNDGAEVYPIITVTPVDAENTSFSLKNTSDNNRTFGYNDAQLIVGESLVVSSIAGTVLRSGENAINNMGGTFLKLVPGANVITYTGAIGSEISIKYVERWA